MAGETRLTKTRVEAAQYEATTANGRCVLWDGELPGFGVRIFPSGRKSFVLSYRNAEGRKRLMSLGAFGPLSVDGARKLACKRLAEVADAKDPLQERREARRRTLTVQEHLRAWLKRGGRKGSRQSARDDKRRLERYVLPALGKKRLAHLTRKDMEGLHGRISSRGRVEANRTLELLRRIFNELPKDVMTGNPAAGPWRSKKGAGNRERSRTRFLQTHEYEAFARAVEAQDVYVRAAIWLLLLTGARSASELLRLRWSDVDLEGGLVTFHRTKTGEPNTLPLSGPAKRILEELPRERGNAYVFPSPRNVGEHRAAFRKPWEKVCAAAGVEDLTLHDLRRSAGALMASAGVPLLHIGAVLGHKSQDVTEVYARIGGDETKAAVDTLGRRVEDVRRVATATSGEEALEAEIAAGKVRLAEVGGRLKKLSPHVLRRLML